MSERDQTERDPTELADQMEREAREMQQRTDELGDEVSEVREDWQRKRSDQAIPGANPPDDGGDADHGEDAENRKPDGNSDDQDSRGEESDAEA